jgi:hypothetical protein
VAGCMLDRWAVPLRWGVMNTCSTYDSTNQIHWHWQSTALR